MRQMNVHREYVKNSLEILKAFAEQRGLVHIVKEYNQQGMATGKEKQEIVTDTIDLADLENYRIT